MITFHKKMSSYKNIILPLFIIWITFSVGCQKGFEEIEPLDSATVIESSSPLFTQIRNVIMLDGSLDDILDGASCLLINLPVTISISGTQLIVTDTTDYLVISNTLKKTGLTPDNIQFEFPISISLPDHSQENITGQNELIGFTSACQTDGLDADIESIDFNYPIRISVYNATSDLADIITMDDDERFSEFMAAIKPEDILSIQYPIEVVEFGNTIMEASNNIQLSDEIEVSQSTYDENDDLDISSALDSELIGHLTDGIWVIETFFDKEDLTLTVNPFDLTFSIDGMLVGTNGASTEMGSWRTSESSNDLILRLIFDSGLDLDIVDNNWNVASYDSQMIVLTDSNSSGGVVAYIVMQRSRNVAPSPLESTMTTGIWVISEFIDADNDDTSDFSLFSFDFQPENTVNATDMTDSFVGNWSSILDATFVLDFDSPLNKINRSWQVTSFDSTSLVFENFEDPNINRLVFSKQ